jgi:hypothetical protein
LTSSNPVFEALDGLTQGKLVQRKHHRTVLVGLLLALGILWSAVLPAQVDNQPAGNAVQLTAQDLPVIDDLSSIRLPADWNRVQFFLITVDVGNRL